MKKQVACIHGGQVYDTYELYLKDLKTFTVDPYKEKKRWRIGLQEKLGSEYEVFMPEMPNKFNAQYEEWEIWFEKYVSFLRNEVILVGHSLGASFLLKYLSTRTLSVSVSALYLIAAPYFDISSQEGGSFRFSEEKLINISKNVSKITFFHSNDDAVVPFSHFEAFKRVVTNADFKEIDGRGHFNQEEFPELVEGILGVG